MPELSDAKWVRLSFVDVFGESHSVQIPASRLESVLANGEPFDGSTLQGRARSVETDMLLLPDSASLMVSGPVARVVCTVLTADGSPWPGDPRTALAIAIAQAEELGRDLRMATELEFYLLDDDGPVDARAYFDDAETFGMSVAREAAERLAELGVPVDSVHHEAGPGQYEIDLAMLPAMRAADSVVLAREVVREAASDAGVRATFMPRPLSGEAGSGMHVHSSVASALIAENGALTELGSGYVAGLLAHARGLTALGSPTVNSYKRLHSGPEAPGSIVWAHVNRGALVRVSPLMAGGAIEYRSGDPAANPYLFFAGLLTAASHGIGAGLELPDPVEEASDGFDPAALDSVRAGRLPQGLSEALDALLGDDVLVDTFDPQLLSNLVEARRAEVSDYEDQVTPWEIERYLDEA